jgi:hypothetical protein
MFSKKTRPMESLCSDHKGGWADQLPLHFTMRSCLVLALCLVAVMGTSIEAPEGIHS